MTKMNLPIFGVDVEMTDGSISNMDNEIRYHFRLTLSDGVGQVLGQTASDALNSLLQIVEVLAVIFALDVFLDGLNDTLNVLKTSAKGDQGIVVCCWRRWR